MHIFFLFVALLASLSSADDSVLLDLQQTASNEISAKMLKPPASIQQPATVYFYHPSMSLVACQLIFTLENFNVYQKLTDGHKELASGESIGATVCAPEAMLTKLEYFFQNNTLEKKGLSKRNARSEFKLKKRSCGFGPGPIIDPTGCQVGVTNGDPHYDLFDGTRVNDLMFLEPGVYTLFHSAEYRNAC